MIRKSIVSENDFNVYIGGGFAKVTDTSTLANNSWSYSPLYKAARINDSSASLKGCFTLRLGYLKKGDSIKFSAEFLNITGVKGKLGLDYSLTNPSGFGTGFVFAMSSIKSDGQFEVVELDTLIDIDAYYSLVIGMFTADIGDFYVRNVVVDIDSKYTSNNSIVKGGYVQGFRTYVIRNSGASFVAETNFHNDFCTMIVDSVNKEINLLHEKPFATKAGVPFLGQGSSGVSPNYIVRTQSEDLNGCKIKIYDHSTNTLIDPATVVGGLLWFTLLFSGLDIDIKAI